MLLFKLVVDNTLDRNSLFSYCSMSWKNFRHSTSSFIIVYKQTSSAIVCSDWPITVQFSSRFPARNWTCSNRRQFLAPEKSGTRKVWQTDDQFLEPVNWYQKQASETGQCVITITTCPEWLIVKTANCCWSKPFILQCRAASDAHSFSLVSRNSRTYRSISLCVYISQTSTFHAVLN